MENTLFRLLVFLFLVFNLLLLIFLVLRAYQTTRSLETRQKIVIVLLAASLGFLPVLGCRSCLRRYCLSPWCLLACLFYLLSALPAGYGYAILRHRLLRLERTVHHGAAYAFVAILIGFAYVLVALKVFPHLLSQGDSPSWEWFLLNLILILAAYPLYKLLLRFISHLLYGGWYDDRVAVQQISQALCETGEGLHSLARILCQTLQRSMQLEYVNLLLKDGDLFSSDGQTPVHKCLENTEAFLMSLKTNLKKEIGGIGDLPVDLPFDAETRLRVLGPKPQIWLLLCTDLQPLGMLILGYQRGNKPIEPQDLATLEVILRQTRIALENAVLLDEIQQRSDTIRRLHYRLMQTREEERKRLSRDLHDQAIQSLVGLSYRLV
jgi:signal transduction histidine kinase